VCVFVSTVLFAVFLVCRARHQITTKNEQIGFPSKRGKGGIRDSRGEICERCKRGHWKIDKTSKRGEGEAREQSTLPSVAVPAPSRERKVTP
jgi:hypothetical protein